MPFRDVSPGARGMFEMAQAPVNAFFEGQQNARRNQLSDLRAQQMQRELDDDAEWDAAYARKDWDTLMRIDPQATETLRAFEQQKAMSGLGEIPISRQPIDMQQLQRTQMDERKFAADEQHRQRQYNLDVAAEGRMREQANAPAAGPKPADIVRLRKEFRGLQPVKDYETALPLLVSARNAPDDGYGDLQLIYTAGKVLDPGSVVREGELALTVAAGSPLQRAIGQTRFSIEGGGRLTPETRKQLLNMLNERVLAYRQGYDREYGQYAEYGQAQGMVPRDVVGRHAANAYQPAAPQRKEAPPAAIEKLKQNPQLKAAFKAKYGYLPDGI